MVHATTARILSQPGITVSYGFFGTPYVSVAGPRGNLTADLNELAEEAYAIFLSTFDRSQNKDSAMDYIVAGYLVGKAHHLYGLAEAQIEKANFITRFFIAARRCLSDCLDYIYILHIRTTILSDDFAYGATCLEIPKPLVLQDAFLKQHLPKSISKATTYTYDVESVTRLFEGFIAQDANQPAQT